MPGFLDGLQDGIETLVRDEVEEHIDEAKADIRDFLDSSKDKLERWFQALTDGTLAKDEFEFLVKSQRDLAKMRALTEIGLAKVRIQRIVNGVIDLIVDTAFDAIP